MGATPNERGGSGGPYPAPSSARRIDSTRAGRSKGSSSCPRVNSLSGQCRKWSVARMTLTAAPSRRGSSSGSLGRREQQRRIDPRAIQHHAEMQVRAGDPPGGADFTDERAGRELIADLHVDLAQVAVHGHQALAVVDDHVVAVEE